MQERPTLTQINKISGNNNKFRDRLISIIKTELVLEVSTYQKNLSLEKYIDCAENVHKLKHKIGILGLKKSYEVAVLFEEDLRKSDLKNKNAFNDIIKLMLEFTSQL